MKFKPSGNYKGKENLKYRMLININRWIKKMVAREERLIY